MKEKLYKKVILNWWEINYDYSKRDDYGNWQTVNSCDRFYTEEEAKAGYYKRHTWMFENYHDSDFIKGEVLRPVKKEIEHYEELSEEEARKILEDK